MYNDWKYSEPCVFCGDDVPNDKLEMVFKCPFCGAWNVMCSMCQNKECLGDECGFAALAKWYNEIDGIDTDEKTNELMSSEDLLKLIEKQTAKLNRWCGYDFKIKDKRFHFFIEREERTLHVKLNHFNGVKLIKDGEFCCDQDNISGNNGLIEKCKGLIEFMEVNGNE